MTRVEPMNPVRTSPVAPIVLGAGKMADLLLELYAVCCQGWPAPRLFDDSYPEQKLAPSPFNRPVLPIEGELADGVRQAIENKTPTFIALGSRCAALRHALREELRKHDTPMPNLIHPGLQRARSCELGQGLIVFAGCVLGPHVKLGDGAILFHGVVLEHDTQVEENVWLAPGVVTSGYVRIGAHSFIGTGAVLSCESTIGARSVIGAGAVVVRDIPVDTIAFGCPAKPQGSVRQGMDAPRADEFVAGASVGRLSESSVGLRMSRLGESCNRINNCHDPESRATVNKEV